MNLVNNRLELQEYVNVTWNFDFDKALPFIKRAERKYIIPNIGKEEYTTILNHDGSDSDIAEVKYLLAEASANLAFHLGFSQLCVHITNYGTKQTELEDTKSIDWATKRDLQRGFTDTGFEAIDEALKAMEYYVDKFPDWRDSAAYSVFNEHFNKRTDEFQQHFNISSSRKTFIALKPIVRKIEEQYFLPMLGEEAMNLIKTRTMDPVLSRALDLCQKAEVALTIAKSVDSGAFVMTGSSAMYIWEQLPWEKTSEYSDERLHKLKDSQQKDGEEYLKKLNALLVKHPDVFPIPQRESKPANKNIIKLKSGLGL
ncbi:hypothetical protein FOF46_30735 [Aquimarina algiphila]|uniref:Uncharacterized protein n=1 Tax=Aquimarina algiphila TaxID=2047982 RepID=A0A554VA67_9FLAO|nr:DUF6712 family protein [Aquimarina algiphila]TSE02602.1 hypothetical protein FOF46_30735 [Aquimarina algiphila]